MKTTRKEKKTEAIKRMRLMKLLPNIIKEFEKDDVLYYSEMMGILYWVSNNQEWAEYIGRFEKKYDALVYHAELSMLEFGDCLSLFYVSDHKDEWEHDLLDLKDGYPIVYVWNIDDPSSSEFGGIGFKSLNGGVKRTA